MKKKSLITMFLSLALVAVIGTGATLAYLSASSNTVTNTFTVGSGYDKDDSLYLDEVDLGPTAEIGDRTKLGNEYTEILPGDTLSKDPTVHFTQGPDSYIFVKVTGMNEATINNPAENVFTYLNNMLGSTAITGAWEKIDGTLGLNGVYVYHVGSNYKVVAGTPLVQLFTGVQLNGNVNVAQFNELKGAISDITIQAAAVQFDNVTGIAPVTDVKAAYALVTGLFN